MRLTCGLFASFVWIVFLLAAAQLSHSQPLALPPPATSSHLMPHAKDNRPGYGHYVGQPDNPIHILAFAMQLQSMLLIRFQYFAIAFTRLWGKFFIFHSLRGGQSTCIHLHMPRSIWPNNAWEWTNKKKCIHEVSATATMKYRISRRGRGRVREPEPELLNLCGKFWDDVRNFRPQLI